MGSGRPAAAQYQADRAALESLLNGTTAEELAQAEAANRLAAARVTEAELNLQMLTATAPADAVVDRTDHLAEVAAAVPGAPLYAGSGVTMATAKPLLKHCTGLIVGTSLKVDGVSTNPVERKRAEAFVEEVGT